MRNPFGFWSQGAGAGAGTAPWAWPSAAAAGERTGKRNSVKQEMQRGPNSMVRAPAEARGIRTRSLAAPVYVASAGRTLDTRSGFALSNLAPPAGLVLLRT